MSSPSPVHITPDVILPPPAGSYRRETGLKFVDKRNLDIDKDLMLYILVQDAAQYTIRLLTFLRAN